MRSYIVRTENIKGRIQDFRLAIEAMARVTGAKMEVFPCLEIKTENEALAILLENMVGKVAPAEKVAVVEKTKKTRIQQKATGVCSNCGREAQLVKKTGTCKPCYMSALKKAKAEGRGNTPEWMATERRMDAIVQDAKEKEAAGQADPFTLPHAQRDFVAVKRF